MLNVFSRFNDQPIRVNAAPNNEIEVNCTFGVLTGSFPTLSLIALLPMPLAFFALYGAVKYGAAIGKYPQYLGANVAVTILTTLLLGISLVI